MSTDVWTNRLDQKTLQLDPNNRGAAVSLRKLTAP